MALAALFAVTLLIGIGFTAIGLLVGARQDGSLALAPANDPWRTVLRPVEERPVTLMTSVIEPAAKAPASADLKPVGPAPESLDGTLVATARIEAPSTPAPAADLEPVIEAKLEPQPEAKPEPVIESTPLVAAPEPVVPAPVVPAPVQAVAPPVEAAPSAEVIAVAPLIEPPAVVAPAEPAPQVGDPLPIATALDDGIELTASIVLPVLPSLPQREAAPAVGDLPAEAALQPAAIAVPPLPLPRPILKPPKKKAAARKVPSRAKANVRPQTPVRPAAAGASQQSGSVLQGIFGSNTNR